jgi:2-oxoglutarate ferredoxin oxidoreductase subunit gamma
MAEHGPAVAGDSEHRLIAAGSGGQGVLTLAKLLCTAAMDEGKTVTYFPSYGAEVRGGTANCQVVLSTHHIHAPLVEHAHSLIVLNQPSYERFLPRLTPGGLLVANTSAVDLAAEPPAHAITVALPAAETAARMGDVRVGNVIMLGAFAAACHVVSQQACRRALRELFVGRRAGMLDLNLAAFQAGIEMAAAGA